MYSTVEVLRLSMSGDLRERERERERERDASCRKCFIRIPRRGFAFVYRNNLFLQAMEVENYGEGEVK
jgi:hypothetical protein